MTVDQQTGSIFCVWGFDPFGDSHPVLGLGAISKYNREAARVPLVAEHGAVRTYFRPTDGQESQHVAEREKLPH